MADVNSFAFTGRLTKDAELKTVGANNKTLLQLSVANNTGFGDYKKTNWLTVKMWGDRGANLVPIFKKGSLVGGSGELTTEEWTGKDGTTHVNLVVTVMNIQILSSKKEEKFEADSDPQQELVF